MADQSGILQGNYAGIPALLHLPEFRSEIVDLYHKQKLMELMQWLGTWEKTKDDKYYSARSQPGFYSIDTTSSTVTNSGTPTVTITGLLTAQSGKAIVGDLVILPAGTQARIQSVVNTAGQDTIVIQSFAAGTPNLTLVAGNTIRQFSNAQEEGSKAPASRVRGLDYIYNQVGVNRKTFTATDIQKMREGRRLLVELDGKETEYSVEHVQQYLQHRAEIASGLFMNQMSDPNFSNASPTVTGEYGRGVQTTRGVIPTINQYGTAVACASAGAPALSDWENVLAAIAANDGSDHYVFMGATRTVTRASSAFKGLGSSSTSNVRINLGANETYINLMVERIEFGDKQLDFVTGDVFDVAGLFPITGADYKTLWGVPMGNYSVLSESGKAVGAAPYLKVRYGAVNSPGIGTEMDAEVRLGALAPTATNGDNVDQTTWCSIAGIDTPKPEAFLKLTGVLA